MDNVFAFEEINFNSFVWIRILNNLLYFKPIIWLYIFNEKTKLYDILLLIHFANVPFNSLKTQNHDLDRI